MLLLLLPVTFAGTHTDTDEIDFSAGTTDSTSTSASSGDVVLTPFVDNGEWYNMGTGNYIGLQKDDSTWFNASECPSHFMSNTASYNGVPFRGGPYSLGGGIAGMVSGVEVSPPSGTNFLESVHYLHPGGRCGAQGHTLTWTYSDGSSYSDSYTNSHDCGSYNTSGSTFSVSHLGTYGGSCCDNWYEAAFTNPSPSKGVSSVRMNFNDGCGGSYPGQMWAVTFELTSSEYNAFASGSGSTSGTFTSAVIDTTLSSAVWESISWSSTLGGSDTITLAVRTGEASGVDSTWSSWSSELSTSSGETLSIANGRYAQYRTTFTGTDASTALHEVTIDWITDDDGDGFFEPNDCDDGDASIYPGAVEVEDGADNDCNGTVDEGTNAYDDDGDGWTENNGDCDDSDGGVSPDATEVCDGVDNNCDSATDESTAADASDWYADSDGDGYGSAAAMVSACALPSGYVSDATDCDDSNSATHPSATEFCNTIDDDCDATIDEPDASDASTWYNDSDGDGYGDPSTSQAACAQPGGYVANGADCDDSNASVNPAVTETCNTIDDNCDGTVDESTASDAPTWYLDSDSDGYGDPASSIQSCLWPGGYSANASDCDDSSASVSPAATETCNTVDDNCDGSVDEASASDASTWYMDADTDGFGNAVASTLSCNQPSGYISDATDCDDSNAAVNPNATEICNGVDDDCDGTVDGTDAADASTWYADVDSDGYGDILSPTVACSQPSGFLSDSSDCDDNDADVSPLGTEVCDGIDNDCDGTLDGGDAADASTWYADFDADGFGDPDESVFACEPPSGFVADSLDCDDEDADRNPDAEETWYDGVDSDCGGDDDYDADGDGYVSESYEGDDCDDADPDTWPGAPDTPYDGVINDCNNASDFDADGDGFDLDDDCDDANSDINPETSNDGVDSDCDGEDNYDGDGDGVAAEEDCDDSDPQVGACDTSGLDLSPTKDNGSCGCATGSNPTGALWGLLIALSTYRRRRSA